MKRNQSGQATAEFALILPFLVTLMLCIVQVALVARDAVLVSHAARVGARAAAVQVSEAAVVNAVRASVPLVADRLEVSQVTEGELVRVTVRYRSPTNVPLAGSFIGDVTVSESVAMWDERAA